MKYFCVSFVLIIWMIITLVLAISFIGCMMLFMGEVEDAWFKIPYNLIELLKK